MTSISRNLRCPAGSDCSKAEAWLSYGLDAGSDHTAPAPATPGGFPGFSTAFGAPGSAAQPTPTRALFGSAVGAALGAVQPTRAGRYGAGPTAGGPAYGGGNSPAFEQPGSSYGPSGCAAGPGGGFGSVTPYAQQQATPQHGGHSAAAAGAAALSAMSLHPPASAHTLQVNLSCCRFCRGPRMLIGTTLMHLSKRRCADRCGQSISHKIFSLQACLRNWKCACTPARR